MKNCPNCGVQNADFSLTCENCKKPLPAVNRALNPRTIEDHLVAAILVTIFCCFPFGVVAIVYAAQVSGHLQSGNFTAAKSAADNAWFWIKLSFWIALVLGFLFLLGTCVSMA